MSGRWPRSTSQRGELWVDGSPCQVPECAGTVFKTFRAYIRHYKAAHCPTVMATKCRECRRTFVESARATRHQKHFHQGTWAVGPGGRTQPPVYPNVAATEAAGHEGGTGRAAGGDKGVEEGGGDEAATGVGHAHRHLRHTAAAQRRQPGRMHRPVRGRSCCEPYDPSSHRGVTLSP